MPDEHMPHDQTAPGNHSRGLFGDSGNVSGGIPQPAHRTPTQSPHHNSQSTPRGSSAVQGSATESMINRINWPTVGTSVLASAVVAALFLGFGLQVGRDRMDSAEALANTQTASEQSLQTAATNPQAGSTPRPSATTPAPKTPTPSASAPATSSNASMAAVAEPAGTAGAAGAADRGAVDAADAAGANGAAGDNQQAPSGDNAAPGGEAGVGYNSGGDNSGDNTEDPNTGWYPAHGISASFAATNPNPSLDDLNGVIHSLVATPGSDQDKANNLEGGIAAAVVPRTVYNLGIFREPLGWKRLSGPLTVNGNTASATLNASSAGRPTISMRINFIYQDGRWKLATSSLRNGVQAVGLPVADAF